MQNPVTNRRNCADKKRTVPKSLILSIVLLAVGPTYYPEANAESYQLKQATVGVLDSGVYGNSAPGVRRNVARVELLFDSLTAVLNQAVDYQLTFEAFDIDSEREVRIDLNGNLLGYASVTGDAKRGYNTFNIPSRFINSSNRLVFTNTYPAYVWSIEKILLENIEGNELDQASSDSSNVADFSNLQQPSGAETLAFPGATGYGRHATGGRGGKVVIVNTRENAVDALDGKTSLREALETMSGPRIIVFEVGGIFDTGQQELILEGSAGSNVTVACQTAPSPGVLIKGAGVLIKGGSNNVIMRHCAIRNIDPGSPKSETSRALGIVGTNQGVRNMIFDHMSLSWATDENFMIYSGENSSVGSENFTLSNSIVAEGDSDSSHSESILSDNRYMHSMGPSCNSSSARFRILGCSIVSNLIAHNSRRNPMLNNATGEVLHNIIYNWHETAFHAWAGTNLHVANNVFKFGPSTRRDKKVVSYSSNESNFQFDSNTLVDHESGIVTNLPNSSQGYLAFNATSAQSVNLDCVGASRPARDEIDDRIVQEYINGSGEVGIGNARQRDYSGYYRTRHSASYDTDQDGMSDSWEISNYLDPNDSTDHNKDYDGDGYSNIEEFINVLAECG